MFAATKTALTASDPIRNFFIEGSPADLPPIILPYVDFAMCGCSLQDTQHCLVLDFSKKHARTDVSSLILKRASASRPSGDWNDDDYDVLADGAVVGRIMKLHAAPAARPG